MSMFSPNMPMKKQTQQTFTRSKSTIETLEKDVKYVQKYLRHQNDMNDVILVSLLLTLNIFQFF